MSPRRSATKRSRSTSPSLLQPSAVTDKAGTTAIVLLALATINQWARALIFYTVDFKTPASDEAMRLFMNVDVGFDEAQYGVLASIGFAALFSITSLIAGGLVDKADPRSLLAGTAVLWSGATIGTGAASSFSQVLGARTLTGVGQAFGNPASYTILGKLYPEEQRATVNGLFASSVYFGGGLAALSVLLDDALGWRALHVLIGGLGIGAACVARASIPPLSASTLDAGGDEEAGERRPLRRPSDGETENDGGGAAAAVSAEESLAALRALLAEPTVALLLLASTFRFLAGFTIGVWIVPFYRQAFPGSIGAEFALIKAAVNGVAGSASATGGGLLADRLAARDRRLQLGVPALGSLLAIPCWLGTIDAPTLELSLGALFLEYLFAECWFGPTVAALQAAAPPNAVGLTTGVFSCLTFVGNLAPFVVGLALQSGEYELPQLLMYSVPALYVASAVTFAFAAQAQHQQRRQQE